MLNNPRINKFDDALGVLPIGAASGAIANFDDGAGDMPVKSLVMHFEPVQEGEGDPSPDNVRPITGWTGCEVQRTGVNLCDGVAYRSALSYNIPFVCSFNPITSPYDIVARFDGVGFVAKVKAGQSYVFSSDLTGNNTTIYWGFYKSLASMNNSYNCIQYGKNVGSFTAPVNGYILCMRYSLANTTATWSYAQLELGSTATAYEPYQGTTIPIDWTDEAGTVYGGYVDLAKGEVVAERGYFQLVSSKVAEIYTWNYMDGVSFRNIIPFNGIRLAGICSHSNKVGAYYERNAIWIGVNSTTVYWIGILDILGLSTIDEFKTWLDTQNVQLAYQLPTPIHYPIDPITLTTLRGTNNIFSNLNSNVDVEYRQDIGLAMDKLKTAILSLGGNI